MPTTLIILPAYHISLRLTIVWFSTDLPACTPDDVRQLARAVDSSITRLNSASLVSLQTQAFALPSTEIRGLTLMQVADAQRVGRIWAPLYRRQLGAKN